MIADNGAIECQGPSDISDPESEPSVVVPNDAVIEGQRSTIVENAGSALTECESVLDDETLNRGSDSRFHGKPPSSVLAVNYGDASVRREAGVPATGNGRIRSEENHFRPSSGVGPGSNPDDVSQCEVGLHQCAVDCHTGSGGNKAIVSVVTGRGHVPRSRRIGPSGDERQSN